MRIECMNLGKFPKNIVRDEYQLEGEIILFLHKNSICKMRLNPKQL